MTLTSRTDAPSLAARSKARASADDEAGDRSLASRMRSTSIKPEKKEFVSDGNRLYTHLVADKQVIVSPAPGPDQGDIPAMFLAGQSDLARDYTPSFTPLPGAAPTGPDWAVSEASAGLTGPGTRRRG